MTRQTRLLLLIILCGIAAEKRAYGYIDPSAQGLLTQTLTPILIIAATGVTFLRKQVSAAFRWAAGQILGKKIESGE
jgi:hypothetical protein